MRTQSGRSSQNRQLRGNARTGIGTQFYSLAFGALLFVSMSSSAFAQRGGGGMGGGRGGGMGGGGGGGGGRGGGGRGGGGSAESPAKKIKSDFDASDPVQFLLKRDKPLKLDKAQKDSLKALHKELDEFEKPLFSDVDKLFADAEKNKRDQRDSGEEPAAASGRGGRRMPNGVRELVTKLGDAQLAFKDRARAHLNDGQRHIADSLKVVYDAELLEKEGKQRGSSTSRPGRRGS
ncbi:MAG: hypothetical protein ABJC26_14480 [Gemmatimonadaceae bacterium]